MLRVQTDSKIAKPKAVPRRTATDVEGVAVFYSALRSGSTLLQLMLDGHPQISCPSERDFLLDHLSRDGSGRLVLDREALARDRIFIASGMRLPDTDDGVAAFWDMVAQDRARYPGRGGQQVQLLELHRNLDLLREIVPQAKFVKLVRDPRDVARSSMKLGWAGTTWHGIDHWIATERGWDAHAPAPGDVCALSYEELLAAPEAQLSRVCAHFGLSYDPGMLRYADRSTYEPVDTSLAFQWRRTQSQGEIADVEFKVGDLLTRRGYNPSLPQPRPPSRLRRALLTAQNKRFVWSSRIRRFGLRDTVLVMLANRSGLGFLGHAAQLRINQKVQQNLK